MPCIVHKNKLIQCKADIVVFIIITMLNKSNFVTNSFPGLVITEIRNNSFNTVSVSNTFFMGMSLVYVLFVSILKSLAGNNDLFYNSRPNQLIFSNNF